MKFLVPVVVAAGTGVLAVFAVPASFVGMASHAVRQIHLADLNPIRAVFDYEQQQVRTPMTPQDLGFHASPMTLSPVIMTPPQSLGVNLGQSFDPQAQMEIEQNNRRMQDMQAYMRDPNHWMGPPPQ